eukprot:RCo003346
MNLEKVKQKHSVFKEISDIQAHFGTMVEKLMEYKAYLPVAILGSRTEGSEGERSCPIQAPAVDSCGSGACGCRVNPTSGHSLADVVVPTGTPSSVGRSSVGGREVESVRGAVVPSAALCSALGTRVVSVLQVDVGGFHSISAERVAEVHSMVLHTASQVFQAHKGMPSPICGDKLLAFWNVR